MSLLLYGVLFLEKFVRRLCPVGEFRADSLKFTGDHFSMGLYGFGKFSRILRYIL